MFNFDLFLWQRPMTVFNRPCKDITRIICISQLCKREFDLLRTPIGANTNWYVVYYQEHMIMCSRMTLTTLAWSGALSSKQRLARSCYCRCFNSTRSIEKMATMVHIYWHGIITYNIMVIALGDKAARTSHLHPAHRDKAVWTFSTSQCGSCPECMLV